MTARVAIVGSGLGGFVAYATLRHGGLEPAEIAVFGDDPDPAGAWRPRAAAIRQKLMRSESDGHCWPTSFPGLAAREAVRRRDLAPLMLSVCDRYRPTVSDFLRHVDELRERSGWDESFRRTRIERVLATDGGFDLDGHGTFRHVLLAPGHPGLAVPAELAARPARRPRLRAARVRVARGDRRRRDGGSDGVAERARVGRRGGLGAPARARRAARSTSPGRSSPSAASSSFRATPATERAALLRNYGEPSYPPGRSWDEPLERAARAGRFRVESGLNGSLDGAEQVICATGFQQGFEHDLLLARLVAEHELETEDRWIVLADDSTVPALTDATRTLALAGVSAQWAFPAADTLVGMKVAARGFRRRIESCPTR